jgi:hypothetical protein
MLPHTKNGCSNPIRVFRESSSSLTSRPSVSLSSSGPPRLLNSSSGLSLFLPFSVLSPFLSLFCRGVGVISEIFVCASWGLCATDRMISVVARSDDTDSIAPPDSARTGGLHSKWTGGALRARQAPHPFAQAGGSRRRRFALRRLELQCRLALRQLTRRLPDAGPLALLACFGPAAALWSSLAIRLHRHTQFPWRPCRPWALPWLFPAC